MNHYKEQQNRHRSSSNSSDNNSNNKNDNNSNSNCRKRRRHHHHQHEENCEDHDESMTICLLLRNVRCRKYLIVIVAIVVAAFLVVVLFQPFVSISIQDNNNRMIQQHQNNSNKLNDNDDNKLLNYHYQPTTTMTEERYNNRIETNSNHRLNDNTLVKNNMNYNIRRMNHSIDYKSISSITFRLYRNLILTFHSNKSSNISNNNSNTILTIETIIQHLWNHSYYNNDNKNRYNYIDSNHDHDHHEQQQQQQQQQQGRRFLQGPKQDECKGNCFVDTGCKAGLLCARIHSAALVSLGYHPNKAYCDVNNPDSSNTFCYNPTKINNRTINECNGDCYVDNNCRIGLQCTRSNQASLLSLGYNTSRAYCSSPSTLGADQFVCYNSTKINNSTIGVCNGNCTVHDNCQSGLQCTRPNQVSLVALGYNRTQAYCPSTSSSAVVDQFLCYNPIMVNNRSLAECQTNCYVNDNCQAGLECARTNQVSLLKLGYNNSQAYCSSTSISADQFVCYDPSKINNRSISECETNCSVDNNCEDGLQCARTNQVSLLSLGYNNSQAYCPTSVMVSIDTEYVCYDPDKINNSTISECGIDCYVDGNCQDGLLCARANQIPLLLLGYDTNEAYCAPAYNDTQYVCYDPLQLYNKTKKDECELGCRMDDDCLNGYYCSADHFVDLEYYGLNTTYAYCTPPPFGDGSIDAVCFDPIKTSLECYDSDVFIMDRNTTLPKCCRNIAFDDITDIPIHNITGDQYQIIPNGYQGFNWDNFYVQTMPSSPLSYGYDSGFMYGTKSYPNHAFNGYGLISSIASMSDARTILLRRFSMTSALSDDLNVTISGRDNATALPLALYEYELSNYTESLIFDFPDFPFANTIQIDGSSMSGLQPSLFVIDDMIICHMDEIIIG